MSVPAAFQPVEILAALDRHGVMYVLVGGYAAQLHGSTLPTTDVDITPASDHENLDRLAAALRELDAGIRVDDLPDGLPFDTSADALAGMRTLNLRTAHGDIDLTFAPDGTDGYPDLIRAATPRRVADIVVQVASLDDVIRSKQAAARAKDLRALPDLLRLAAAQRADPEAVSANQPSTLQQPPTPEL